MRFKKIILKEGIVYKREIDFEKNTLIHSSDNSQGKTTLIRLLLHTLGYQIISTSKMDFNTIYCELHIEYKGDLIILARNGYVVDYKKGNINYTFLMPNEQLKLQALIFDVMEVSLLENLLGSFYIDQTKGTVVLNRGEVISKNKFSIENYIAGLQGEDIDALNESIKEEQKNLNNFKCLKQIAQYKIENNIDVLNNDTIDFEDSIQKRRYDENNIKKQKNKIKELNEILIKNKGFVEIIENYKISVSYQDAKIPVNKDTIFGFEDNVDILTLQLKLHNIELKMMEREFKKFKTEESQSKALLTAKEYKESLDERLKGIDVDINSINSIIDETNKNILRYRNDIKAKFIKKDSVKSFIDENIVKAAKKLGVGEYITNKGVLTKNVNNNSGAIAFKLIIAFKIAYLLALYNFRGISLPLVIDSLRNGELTEENSEIIVDVIHEMLPSHQLIIASIYKYKNLNGKIVEIKGRLIDEFI